VEAKTPLGSVLAAAIGRRRRTWILIRRLIVTAVLALCAVSTARASDLDSGPPLPAHRVESCHVPRVDEFGSKTEEAPEPDNAGIHIILDEHLLVDGSRDSDYNGGGEITISGARAASSWYSVDGLLGGLDHVSRFAPKSSRSCGPTHAFAAGILVFTPRDLQSANVVPGDRPYASLFFISSGRRYLFADKPVALGSSITIGALGLPAAGSLQNALHRVTGSEQAQGWSHQISAGGEPTFRYDVARQALLTQSHGDQPDFDATWTAAASVGTVTEGSLALSTRFGRIRSPWWAFTPEQSMYVDETRPAAPPVPVDSPAEVFVMVGGRVKLRAYNAFLQGQFRHSDLRYGSSDVNPVLGEAWAGVEWRTSSGFELRYLTRWESPELRHGAGSRSFVWASLEASQSFGGR
jgi:hypothetical protein